MGLSFEGMDGPAVTLWEIETVHYVDCAEQRSIATRGSPSRRQPDPAER